MNGIMVLVVYAVLMIVATIVFAKRDKDSDSFYVGNRNMGTVRSAMSIAATWIWAPALFTSAEKAYLNGVPGLFWFLVPNILCLLIFIPFAKRIRKEMPNGITLSGYMHKKYRSEKVKGVYLFQLTMLTVLSTAVQLLAGGQDTQRGHRIATVGNDDCTGSHRFFIFANIRDKGVCTYGCYSDDISSTGVCDIRSVGTEIEWRNVIDPTVRNYRRVRRSVFKERTAGISWIWIAYSDRAVCWTVRRSMLLAESFFYQ